MLFQSSSNSMKSSWYSAYFQVLRGEEGWALTAEEIMKASQRLNQFFLMSQHFVCQNLLTTFSLIVCRFTLNPSSLE